MLFNKSRKSLLGNGKMIGTTEKNLRRSQSVVHAHAQMIEKLKETMN